MNSALQSLVQDASNNGLTVEYDAISVDFAAYHGSNGWFIRLGGKGTYPNKALIKENDFKWNAATKKWQKFLENKNVPLEERDRQRQEQVELAHAQGLTYPNRVPKCPMPKCNEESRDGSKCSSCVHAELCKGGLQCNGWMSTACKYHTPTMKGHRSCKGCYDDIVVWNKQGGKGGWFANDRS